MTDIFLQDVLAEQDCQQDTYGGANEIKDVGLVELCIDDNITDAVCQLLNDDSGCSGQKTCGDAEQNHETAIRHVSCTPIVELVNPSVEFVF